MDMNVAEGALGVVVYLMTVVVAGAAEDEVGMKNSLMVWTLAIQIYSSPIKNG